MYRIVAFGDSTTAARFPLEVYAERLHEQLTAAGQDVTVINAGVRGDHTHGAVARLEADVLQRDPHVVIVQFGLNDAAVDVWKTPPATGPRVALADYQSNLATIVQSVQAIGAAVILMTPNPLAWTPQLRLLYDKSPYDTGNDAGFNSVLSAYVEVVHSVALATKARCVDIFQEFQTWTPAADSIEQSSGSYAELLLDGMHPNDRGHALIAAQLLPVVMDLLHSRG